MALIECPECKREVSDQSANCIFCGYPIMNKPDEGELPAQKPRASVPPKFDEAFVHWESGTNTISAAGIMIGFQLGPPNARRGPCPYCMKDAIVLEDYPVSCRKCHKNFIMIDQRFYKYFDPTPPPVTKPVAQEASGNQALLSLAFMGICFLMLWGACSLTSNEHPAKRAAEEAQKQQEQATMPAYFYAQDHVKDLLKAPATADFPAYSPEFVSGSGSDFKVNSYVDAQNGFGAKIRTRYSCNVHIVDDKHAQVSCSLAK